MMSWQSRRVKGPGKPGLGESVLLRLTQGARLPLSMHDPGVAYAILSEPACSGRVLGLSLLGSSLGFSCPAFLVRLGQDRLRRHSLAVGPDLVSSGNIGCCC